MPRLDHSIPKLNRKSLNNRALRAESVRLVVAMTEPAQICCQLRQHRNMFHKRMVEVDSQPVCVESNADLCRLQSAYASISNLLLRLAKVPQAPSGAQNAPQEARPTLDVLPEPINGKSSVAVHSGANNGIPDEVPI